ncbi:MAG: exodeoxyribonuclease III [Hydrogenophilales bacterium CG_4_10_14_3_um_filter_58_23]|nr:MAG: exodeoxyribonuclease III [Hydrogenophilales bacterium CG18_big_fil_WC_8_21_14_2_50_58_12]PIY00826.1 MAG: exodeoxyribonuclease III [Hydrogenophilales bacterium CG_4_10_14_3_um_filter_58_23]
MKIATWNVNSLKVRLPQVLDWLAAHQPDVLCLQETKLEDVNFPTAEITATGYQVLKSGQKTYNGVAILSKNPATEVVTAIPCFVDVQKRVLAATIAGVRIINLYIPNGQSVDSDKFQYKLGWLGALTAWLADELARHPKLVVLGDFNIAPEERDVHDPKAWEGQVLFSLPEREAFRRLVDLGLADSFRLFEQPEKSYSWWDYRMNAFRRNMGLRIDHILLSPALAEIGKSCTIDKEARKAERPSDHAPVMVEF